VLHSYTRRVNSVCSLCSHSCLLLIVFVTRAMQATLLVCIWSHACKPTKHRLIQDPRFYVLHVQLHCLSRVPQWLSEVQVLGQMLKSLKALHDGGYAHRNLKPSNVLRRRSHNDWVLADFACTAILSALSSHFSVPPKFLVTVALPCIACIGVILRHDWLLMDA
jgi:hypothetical protein